MQCTRNDDDENKWKAKQLSGIPALPACMQKRVFCRLSVSKYTESRSNHPDYTWERENPCNIQSKHTPFHQADAIENEL